VSDLTVSVLEPTDVAAARRGAVHLAGRLGFSEVETGRVAIVVSEVATNLIKHGGGGQLSVHTVECPGGAGVEIVAFDQGRGIEDLDRSMRDGFSTSGSSGTGLGAIRRLSGHFDIYTREDCGTALVARLWPGTVNDPPPASLRVGGIVIPRAGEQIPGDGWASATDRDGCSILVADGLGHGPQAAEASAAATESFLRHPDSSPADQIAAAHLALRSTRGAAVAVTRIEPDRDRLTFAGIGNISGVVVDDGNRHDLVSLNGIVGHSVRQIRTFEYSWPERGVLIMHSDGLTSHWSMNQYPGLGTADPALIAAVLCRDHRRTYDDVTVVAAVGKRTAGFGR
jgi:anti-sigma regulatory factor (Ser/Thr protein kinase)